VPLYIKSSLNYEGYLTALHAYLVTFFKKTQPLIEWAKIEEQVEETFESEWE
jgi:splicing factor 3A subunit 3